MIRNQTRNLAPHLRPHARPVTTTSNDRYTIFIHGEAVEERGHGRVVREGKPVVTYRAAEDATHAARTLYGHDVGAYVTRESDGAVIAVTRPRHKFEWLHGLTFGAQGGSPDGGWDSFHAGYMGSAQKSKGLRSYRGSRS